jgi:predicted transcriptional regulator YheO
MSSSQRPPDLEAAIAPSPAGRDRHAAIDTLLQIIEPLGAALPPTCEVLLHDLGKLPNSIVAIHGNVTGRQIGDPATDLLLEHVISGGDDHLVGYETQLRDGRRMRSTTMMIKDAHGLPAAALCINTDVSAWLDIEALAAGMVARAEGSRAPAAVAEPAEGGAPHEEFFNDVDEFAAHLLRQSIEEAAVPVELMKKEHKVAVVDRLQDRGMFLLRGAVETVAAALGVSRFAIYKYLNELDGDEESPSSADGPDASKVTASDQHTPERP